MNLLEQLKKDLLSVCQSLGLDLDSSEISIEIPKDDKFGDYSTNLALRIIEKGNPIENAEKIKKALEELKLEYLEKIEVVKPGFINFYLSSSFLSNQLKLLLNNIKKVDKIGQSVVVEFTDPNPFKEFHIGHLYSNIVGESLSRILEFKGNDVKRLCYQGDVGLHVAKAIYGLIHDLEDSKISFEELEKQNLEDRIKFLGQAYAFGAQVYEENEAKKEEINQLNKKIYEKDPSILNLYEKGREWSLDYFDLIYNRLGTHFDHFYFESEAGIRGIKIIKEHLKDGIFEESEGAVIFDGEKYGLHKRVFINSLGLPTYEAKELGLAEQKYEDFKYDQSIIVTAKEVSDYFKVLIKALSLIKPDLAEKTRHIGHGFVKLPEGKMSSRSGNIITGEWLLDESVKKVKESFPEMDKKTAEKVGVGAVKYSLLKSGLGKDVVFDFDQSISLEGNSGPYLQYTFARCLSVMAKKTSKTDDFATGAISREDEALLKKVVKFESQFIFTREISQSTLCTYLYELASIFNLFYQKCPILKSENEDFRLSLTNATSKILEQGLYLLGIDAPEKM